MLNSRQLIKSLLPWHWSTLNPHLPPKLSGFIFPSIYSIYWYIFLHRSELIKQLLFPLLCVVLGWLKKKAMFWIFAVLFTVNYYAMQSWECLDLQQTGVKTSRIKYIWFCWAWYKICACNFPVSTLALAKVLLCLLKSFIAK